MRPTRAAFRLLAPIALSPLFAAWQGSGENFAHYASGEAFGAHDDADGAVSAAASAVAQIRDGRTQVVVLLELPGAGDAVLSIDVDTDVPLSPAWTLPVRGARAVYEEYSAAGRTVVLSEEPTGTVETSSQNAGGLLVRLDLDFIDRTRERWVKVDVPGIPIEPDLSTVTETEEDDGTTGAGVGVAASNGGCDDQEDDYRNDPSWETGSASSDTSSGCEDDTGTDEADTAGESGCEGDDVSTESDTDDTGCDDGDTSDSDTDDDDEGAADSCAGDGEANAAALVGRVPGGSALRPSASPAHRPARFRARLAAKLVSWLPYLIVLGPLAIRARLGRLARSRKFR